MKPTIGRIVMFKPNEDQQKFLAFQGNRSEVLPAVVVAVWSEDCVNLKVFGDGPNDLWVTSSNKGDGPMCWQWPERS